MQQNKLSQLVPQKQQTKKQTKPKGNNTNKKKTNKTTTQKTINKQTTTNQKTGINIYIKNIQIKPKKQTTNVT